MGLEVFYGNRFRKTVRQASLVLSAGVIATACSSADQKSNSLPTPIRISSAAECNSVNLDQVKIGTIKPKDYLQTQFECFPKVKEAKNSGVLKGFLYQPSDQEQETILRTLYSTRTTDEQTLQHLIRSEIDNYKNLKGGHVGSIMPSNVSIFGQKVPLYIIFKGELFTSPAIKNNADVASIAEYHERQHAEDWHNGITLDNIHLAYHTISPETFSLTFLEQLMELRATYRELEAAFKDKVETGKISISSEWFTSQSVNYSRHYSHVKQNAITDLEKRVRDLQLQEFRGITPEITADSIIVKFDLFGKRDSAILKKSGT